MIEYSRVITDEEQKILENDLLDIPLWIDMAIQGKINNCMKRASSQYEEYAKKNNLESIPVKETDRAKVFLSELGYKNRKQREMI
jgi:hypothetical protein